MAVIQTRTLYGNRKPRRPNLLRSDVGREVEKLRDDVENGMLDAGALIVTDEFTDAVAAVANRFKTTSATSLTPVTAVAADLANTTVPGTYERNITVTLSSAVGAYSVTPIEVDIVDMHGVARTLTFTPGSADGGATLQSNEGYCARSVTGYRIPAQADTDGAITIGFGAGFGLQRRPRVRAGLAAVHRQVVGGAVVTTGTILGRRYIPASAPNGSTDYAVSYEADATDNIFG